MSANILTRCGDGYAGRILTLTIDRSILLLPIEGDHANGPAFRVHLDDEDGPEIGAAWKHTGPKAGDYLALELDDPAFSGQPLRAHLFHTDEEGILTLSWNRPQRREDRA